MGIMNDYGPGEPDPFEHLRGRKRNLGGGIGVELYDVATDAHELFQSQGRLTPTDLDGIAPSVNSANVYGYFLGFIREEFLGNDAINVEIAGGVGVDRETAAEQGFVEVRRNGLTSHERSIPTDKLKRTVATDVVSPSWDYTRNRGMSFGTYDDTLEKFAKAIVNTFTRLADRPPVTVEEIERDRTTFAAVADERDWNRLYDEALPALEHAGFHKADEYALVDPDSRTLDAEAEGVLADV